MIEQMKRMSRARRCLVYVMASALNGVSVGGPLAALLLLAKLFDVAPASTWSWWVVFAPVWLPAATLLALFAATLLFLLGQESLRHFKRLRQSRKFAAHDSSERSRDHGIEKARLYH